jgi:hypothetical protein
LPKPVAAEARFIDQAAWGAWSDEPNIPVGARVYAGLNLGATRGLSALVIVWQDVSTFHVKPYCWLPGMQEGSELDRAPYGAWQKLGFITPIGPRPTRASSCRRSQSSADKTASCRAFDRWRINDLKSELDAIGCHVPLEPHGQGFRCMAAGSG